MLSFCGYVQDLPATGIAAKLFSPEHIDGPLFLALDESGSQVIISSNYDEFSTFQQTLSVPVAFTIVTTPRSMVLTSDLINSLFVLAINGLTGK